MSRPSALPVFDTNGTNVTEPVALLESDGYVNGAVPTATNFNYLLNLIWQWLAWLAAGVLDGTFHFTGDVTIDHLVRGERPLFVPLAEGIIARLGGASAPTLLTSSLAKVGGTGTVTWSYYLTLTDKQRLKSVIHSQGSTTAPITVAITKSTISGDTGEGSSSSSITGNVTTTVTSPAVPDNATTWWVVITLADDTAELGGPVQFNIDEI